MSLTTFFDTVDYKELPGYVDWRLPENRLEAFTRVTHWRLVEGDLDHHHTGRVIASEMNLTDDQKAIYCLLFGQSYRNHVAMLVLKEFPNLLDVKSETIVEWHNDNWKRLFYAKDTKWGLRKLPAFIESIKKQVGDKGPYETYKEFASVGDTAKNYYKVNEKLRELYGIGRMTAWLAQQTFYEFFDFDIDHWDLQLYDDTWSQYDSLCYLFDRKDLFEKDKPEPADIKAMEENFQTLMKYINGRIPIHADVYNVESCLCEYRKTAAPRKKPKEFSGWTTTELAMQYGDLKEAWPEVDWTPYVIGLCTKGENARKFWFSTEYFRVILDHGLNFNTHTLYKDEPNAFEVLGLPMVQTDSAKVLLEDWNKVKNQDQLLKKYNPMNFVRYN